jgi:hypothetical protein
VIEISVDESVGQEAIVLPLIFDGRWNEEHIAPQLGIIEGLVGN